MLKGADFAVIRVFVVRNVAALAGEVRLRRIRFDESVSLALPGLRLVDLEDSQKARPPHFRQRAQPHEKSILSARTEGRQIQGRNQWLPPGA